MIERRDTQDVAALLAGAATLCRAGNRVAAIAALLSAVQLDPDDRTVHRRLAAAYALAGDGASAALEYDRYVKRLQGLGRSDLARSERAYAVAILTPPTMRPALRQVAPSTLTIEHRALNADQSFALRRVAVAICAIAVTLTVMFAAGSQIFASGG